MKKTIQINIAGVVFTIEEDAYEKLSAYLAAIQQYFSKYEGNREIVSDIENRIAEKFFDKQKIDNQQVITIDQVNQVITSMGTVADFEAIEEEEDFASPKTAANKEKAKQEKAATDAESPKQEIPYPAAPKKFFRDTKRKVLGGVLAGLANNFNIDVVWVRLIFLLLFLFLPPVSESMRHNAGGDAGAFSGILFIAYIVCWIAFPANNNLEEDVKVKKFYRNPDQKVIGGVASGLSAYFGIDLGVMRFLFVLGIFLGGVGFIAYLLLWIVAPKATTLTQKMEMKGEPVTLSNIESNIKSNLGNNPDDPETGTAKILLLPFRIIAAVLRVLGDILKNLGPVVRIFAGIVLLIISLSWMFGIIVGTSVFFGLTSEAAAPWIHFGDIPAGLFAREVHPMTGVLGFLVFFLPAFAIGIIGVSLIANRTIVGNRSYWITGLGLWLACCLGFGTLIATFMLNFSRHGYREVTKTYTLDKKTLVLDAKDADYDSFDEVSVELNEYDGTDAKLIEKFSATGHTRAEAEKVAENIGYNVTQKDSSLIFDAEVVLPPTAKFRKQRVEMQLYLPYNKPFMMTANFIDHFDHHWGLLNSYGINSNDIEKYQFVMKRDSGVVCLNCPPKKKDNDEEASNDDNNNDSSNDSFSDLMNESAFRNKGDRERNFNLNGFQKIDIGEAFIVNIKQGNQFSISADGDNKESIDDLKAKVEGNTLKVYYENSSFFDIKTREKQVRINITMPKLEYAELTGASMGKITGFNDKNDLTLHLSGASKAVFDGKLNDLHTEVTGASTLELLGSAEKVVANVTGASNLHAKSMKIKAAEAQANGASSVEFGNIPDLHSNTSGASSISRE